MQYRTSIFRTIFLLSALLALMGFIGCVQEDFEPMPPQTGNGVQFTLTVPDVDIPSVTSRTMAGAGTAKKEDEIKTVDVLVFDASKTPVVFLEWVRGTGVTQDLANNNSTVKLDAELRISIRASMRFILMPVIGFIEGAIFAISFSPYIGIRV